MSDHGADQPSPRPRSSIAASLAGGTVVGVIEIVLCTSFAALIFSGPLSGSLPDGTTLILAGAALLLAIMALRTSMPGSVASVQDATAVLVAVIASAAAADVAAPHRFGTVVAVLVVSSAAVGVSHLLLGVLRLGDLVRYVPFPVIGGFLAGTGWLLTAGGLQLLMGSLGWSGWGTTEGIIRWGPGCALAVALFVALRRWSHPLVLPTILGVAGCGFYAVLATTGTTLARAADLGLVLRAAEGRGWRPIVVNLAGSADWAAVADEWANLSALVVVSVLGLLLNASGIEVTVHREADLNRELRASGMANLVTAAVGGAPGYHALSLSALSHRMSCATRLAGGTAAAVCFVAISFGPRIVAVVPTAILGGLILFLGVSFLHEWIVEARTKLSRADHLVIVLILIAVAAAGFLAGFALGIVTTLVLFVANYSRTGPVKHELTGDVYHSRVQRSDEERRALRDEGGQIVILELQGFIFFGTAVALWERVRHLTHDGERRVRFVVVDFRHVTGVDSSAIQSFLKMARATEAVGFSLVLARLPAGIRTQLDRGGLVLDRGARLKVFPDADRALEWCEERLLYRANEQRAAHQRSILELLTAVLDGEAHAASLLRYCERVEVDTGTLLIREGESSSDVFFVETGRLSVHVSQSDAEAIRVRTFGPGAVLGEIGLYLHSRRTARVIADRPGVLYRLPSQAVERMEREDPDTAVALHRGLARMLAERLADTTAAVAALQE